MNKIDLIEKIMESDIKSLKGKVSFSSIDWWYAPRVPLNELFTLDELILYILIETYAFWDEHDMKYIKKELLGER